VSGIDANWPAERFRSLAAVVSLNGETEAVNDETGHLIARLEFRR
jgi:hypothetical protein